MRAIYDIATRAITIDTAGARPWGGDLRAELERHGQLVELANVTFGVEVSRNGEPETQSKTWPSPGVEFESTDQDLLIVFRARWEPDDVVTVRAWIDSPLGPVDAQETFTAPRPLQPFPSWTWENGAWTPPVPYPDDETADYEWDEAEQKWVTII